MLRYDFTRDADREFLKLSRGIQRRIIRKLEFYLSHPTPLAFARKMIGSHLTYRFRIGEYRVVFDWEGDGILILRAGHRREIYR